MTPATDLKIAPDEALGTLFEAHLRLLNIGCAVQSLADELLALVEQRQLGDFSARNALNAVSNLRTMERWFVSTTLECVEAAMTARRGKR